MKFFLFSHHGIFFHTLFPCTHKRNCPRCTPTRKRYRCIHMRSSHPHTDPRCVLPSAVKVLRSRNLKLWWAGNEEWLQRCNQLADPINQSTRSAAQQQTHRSTHTILRANIAHDTNSHSHIHDHFEFINDVDRAVHGETEGSETRTFQFPRKTSTQVYDEGLPLLERCRQTHPIAVVRGAASCYGLCICVANH